MLLGRPWYVDNLQIFRLEVWEMLNFEYFLSLKTQLNYKKGFGRKILLGRPFTLGQATLVLLKLGVMPWMNRWVMVVTVLISWMIFIGQKKHQELGTACPENKQMSRGELGFRVLDLRGLAKAWRSWIRSTRIESREFRVEVVLWRSAGNIHRSNDFFT